MRLWPALSLTAALLALAPRLGAADEHFQPERNIDTTALAALIWAHSPTLASARAQVGAARADVRRSHLLPNPQLDASWGTIPIGTSNPAGLDRPLSQIPNYTVGISELIEVGKRGPRQRAARESLAATGFDAYAQLSGQYFAAMEQLGIIAAAQLRTHELTDLVDDAAQLTTLQRARAAKGDAAELDAERASLEESKLRSTYEEEMAALASALRTCSRVIGIRCEPFASVDDATAFLALTPPQAAQLDERPDLKALDHQRLAALAARDLAENHAIPDPTVRFGYVRDQFVISGNQQNSLFVGVSLPITIADHGQADVLEADAIQAGAAETRDRLTAMAHTAIERLLAQRSIVIERRTRMHEKTLPQARSIVGDLDAVVSRGGASLQELLLARRTLGELLLDASELDREAFNLELELAQTRGWAPPPPSVLNDELSN